MIAFSRNSCRIELHILRRMNNRLQTAHLISCAHTVRDPAQDQLRTTSSGVTTKAVDWKGVFLPPRRSIARLQLIRPTGPGGLVVGLVFSWSPSSRSEDRPPSRYSRGKLESFMSGLEGIPGLEYGTGRSFTVPALPPFLAAVGTGVMAFGTKPRSLFASCSAT